MDLPLQVSMVTVVSAPYTVTYSNIPSNTDDLMRNNLFRATQHHARNTPSSVFSNYFCGTICTSMWLSTHDCCMCFKSLDKPIIMGACGCLACAQGAFTLCSENLN